MSFIIDKQTLNDLAIFSSRNEKSVFGIYNSAKTRGGAAILEEMFKNPLDNAGVIARRADVIDGFRTAGIEFPFKPAELDAAQGYIAESDERTRLSGMGGRALRIIRKGAEYQKASSGILGLIGILRQWKGYVGAISATQWGKDFVSGRADCSFIQECGTLTGLLEGKMVRKIPFRDLCTLDDFFRGGNAPRVQHMLDFLFLCDAFSSIAATAARLGFSKAEVSQQDNVLDIRGLWHPFLTDPVANDISISKDRNIVFLTGANMAGKSTFMKSFGIAVYLAHLGLPVPAAGMTFSVRSGLYTTINLPDDINRGYSHFYAEVRRLKRVAQTVNSYRNMVIIFDELFRGTNVKDAFDATVAVSEAFSGIKESIFMISTHIIEAGDELRKRDLPVDYIYLPTILKDSLPAYTYTLCRGITEDRHGMMIIRREGILDILDKKL